MDSEEKDLNTSPNRFIFQRDRYLERRASEGRTPDTDPDVAAMEEYFDAIIANKGKLERDPSWQENNLEFDLRSTEWICDKVKESRVYAQHLYAALCNNSFQRNDMLPILKDQRWSCSWRYAGGIVSDMREEGDYINWYCSGILGVDELTPEEFNDLTEDQKIYYKEGMAFVSESIITDEIRADLKRLGWLVRTEDKK